MRGKGPETKLSNLKIVGTSVSFDIIRFGAKTTFDGFVDPKNPKQIIGTLIDGDRLTRATLVPSELTELARTDMVKQAKMPEPIAELTKLRQPALALMQSVQKEKDKAKVKEVRKKAVGMLNKIDDENAPGLYRKTIASHADSPYAVTSASSLISMATKLKAPAEEVTKWAEMQDKAAAPYGVRYLRYSRYNLAEQLSTQTGYGELNAKYAQLALEDSTLSNNRRSRAYQILATALEQAGQTEKAKAAQAEFDKLEPILDAEYHKTVPPFQPQKYAGRKDKSANRVAVMELFTGTQCPPCVAADVGFDGLLKTYAPADVILLQYHEHIPGPDPLTNAETVARFEYYGELYDEGFGGTPSTAFNGKAAAGGGGGMANADEKYAEYRKLLNSVLEQSTDIKIGGVARQTGDQIAVQVEVTGMKEPKETTKVRVILIEENIKYVGSNGVRFHHNVVRSLFGKVDGFALKGLKDGKLTAELNVATLRADLKKYLDKYHAEERPFPRPARPLDLKNLKVVVLVQDDETGEILQATQMDLSGNT